MVMTGPPLAGKSSLMQNLIDIRGTIEKLQPSPERLLSNSKSEPYLSSCEPDPPSFESELPLPVSITKINSKIAVIENGGEWRAIDNIHECVSVLQSGPQVQVDQVVKGPNTHGMVILLNIIDTGSQPECHETLPVLINGPALHLIVFNGAESIKDRYTLIYQADPNEHSEVYQSVMTTEDILLQSVSNIASNAATIRSSPTVFVGTHRRSSQDGRLSTWEVDQLVPTQLERDCPIMAAEENKLVFEIDNEKDNADRFNELRNFIAKIIKTNFTPRSIPRLWLVLFDSLRTKERYILQLSECQQLAISLGIPDLHAALEFFHGAGFITYFSSNDELKDIVIMDSQAVLDGITSLIKDTFLFESRAFSRPLLADFKRMGLFRLQDVERAGVSSSSRRMFDCLTPSQLINHLKLRHIVAEVNTEEVVQYFMPCVLPSVKLELPSHELLDSSPSPLLVQLSCGYISAAFSCNLVAQLISKWSLADCVNRNKFHFRTGPNRDLVTLMCWPNYYEVRFSAQAVRAGTLKEACAQVYQDLVCIFMNVSKVLHYRMKPNLGFYCRCGGRAGIHQVFFVEGKSGQVITCEGSNRKLSEAELMWLQVRDSVSY